MAERVKIVYSCLGAPFVDSPRVLYDSLVERSDATHIWLCNDGTIDYVPEDAEAVPYETSKATAALEGADIVIANVCLCDDWNKRPDTFYLQTWHGNPLKTIHNDVLGPPRPWLAGANRDVARWDVLLSPSKAATAVLRKAFGFQGRVHETGYPRNDFLLSAESESRRAFVRRELGLTQGITAVLYAPTWRPHQQRDDSVIIVPPPIRDFATQLTRDHVLLVRIHGDISGTLETQSSAPIVDVSKVMDIADLYLAADILVSDYSSAIFDFAVTGKPIVLYAYDLPEYQAVRGLYYDLQTIAPGPVVFDGDQLAAAVRNIADVQRHYADRYARFRESHCMLQDGHATDRVLGLLPLDPA